MSQAEKKSTGKKNLEKVVHTKSHAEMKNKKSCEENVAEVAENFAQLFMSVTFSLRNIFCVSVTINFC